MDSIFFLVKNVDMTLIKRSVKVKPKASHGVKTWTLLSGDIKATGISNVAADEDTKITWIERVTNMTVLEKMGKKVFIGRSKAQKEGVVGMENAR